MTAHELGFQFRGRLDSNEPNPVEVWRCPDCAALVDGRDIVSHVAWHESESYE